MNDFELPEERLRAITVPTFVLVGGSTPPRLRASADAVVRAVPGAIERVVPKQNHGIKPQALRQTLTELVESAEKRTLTER
jgi:hypothetical protein